VRQIKKRKLILFSEAYLRILTYRTLFYRTYSVVFFCPHRHSTIRRALKARQHVNPFNNTTIVGYVSSNSHDSPKAAFSAGQHAACYRQQNCFQFVARLLLDRKGYMLQKYRHNMLPLPWCKHGFNPLLHAVFYCKASN